MSFSNYLENELLDHVFGGADYARPGTLYVGLSTADPGEDGSGIAEPSNGYARVAKTNNSTEFPAASGGSKSNGAVIQFPTATGSWGTVTHFFISDASSGGNMLVYGALNQSKTVNNGDSVRFNASQLTLALD